MKAAGVMPAAFFMDATRRRSLTRAAAFGISSGPSAPDSFSERLMINASQLRDLVPLASLTPSDRAELARKARTGTYQPGQVIFNRGEQAKSVVYLLTGEVELYAESGATVVKGGTPAARDPISQGAKRAATATVLKPSQVLFVDAEQLDMILTWSQTGIVEVTELGGADGDDWMGALLQSDAFHRIPPGNIAQIFAAMKPVEYAAGDVILREGEPGDYYYVVSQGQVRVTRRGADGAEHEVIQLGVGQGFGEEALVSGDPRNATVAALTPVHAMRLAASEFARLLKASLMREIGVDEIPEEALLVDVRLPDEFRRGRLPGAINLPLSKLREMAAALSVDTCYVIYCDTGRRSASATYLLSERGFDARLLSGGVPADELPVRG
jgi:CRP-like cAMP-binding protein